MERIYNNKLIQILAILFILFTQIHSQTWTEYVSGITSGENASDKLGTSVAILGDYAIIGAPYNDYDENGATYLADAGAVYILKYNSGTSAWTQFQKIVAADRAAGDYFGNSVAFNGSYILIGAEGYITVGAAYFYKYDTANQKWVQSQKVVQYVPTADDNFGCSVAMTSTHAVIGVSLKYLSVTNFDAGAAYIYKLNKTTNNWDEEQMITASDQSIISQFGHSVSIYGSYIVVGSPRADNGGNAYVFYENPSPRNGEPAWIEKQIIKASDYAVNDRFGSSVSIYNDYFVVGDYSEDEDVNAANTLLNSGSAYIFQHDIINNTWVQRQKITATERAAADYFGTSVAIYDNYIVIGAINEDEDASNANPLTNPGSVYFFKYNTSSAIWEQQQKIVASNREAQSEFGRSVAITASNIIVGSPKKDGTSPATDVGSSYIYFDLSLLPVELTSFTANYVDGKVELNWQTATEVNNYGFEIERQKSDVKSETWETVGFVEGHGNSNSPKDYSFVDSKTSDVFRNLGVIPFKVN